MSEKALNTATTQKNFAPELVRAFAIFLVIVVHTACGFLVDHSSRHAWNVANLMNSFARPCVPLFFMLTGSLLLGSPKEETILEFYKKRFRRIIVPFSFWAFVYFGWRHFHHHESMHVSKMLRELLDGPIFYHFGFMFSLISLYLVVPYLKIIVRHSSIKSLIWFVILWVCAQTFPVFPAFMWKTGIAVPNELFTHYLGYLVLGFCLARFKPSKAQIYQIVAIFLLGYGATVLGTSLVNNGSNQGVNELFYDYVSPNVILQSACLFVLLLTLGRRFEGSAGIVPDLIRFVGSSSLGIYLMQSLVIELLYLPKGTMPLPLYIGEAVLVVMSICVVTCYFVKKIPFLREVI